MAERQETSVMASIQDILRDAQLREEQEKVAAQRRAQEEEQLRLDALRRQQEQEDARLRSEEEERQRRAFEEQRKAAEISALQEATVQRARMEAEAQARLAEMAAQQDHERRLNALKNDKSKKTLTYIAIGFGVFLLIGGIGGGLAYKAQYDKGQEIARQLHELEEQKTKAEAERIALKSELENTKDPEQIAKLQAQLAEKEAKISNLNNSMTEKGHPGVGRPVGGGPAVKPPVGGGGGTKAPCNCAKGDPLCSCF